MTFSLRRSGRTVEWWRRSGRFITLLSPPYQRQGGQWSERQKSHLIDSILNGYDLPKFYLADFNTGTTSLLVGDGQYEYAVIDGRQRLETLTEFITGELRLDEQVTLIDDPVTSLKGVSFRELASMRDDLAARFDDFMLDIILVVTDDEARVNDMFIRLNSGTGLTGAQVRNAMLGRWPQVIRDLAKHIFFQDHIKFSTRQGQHLNVAAKLLMLEFRGSLVDTKRRQLDNFVRADESAASTDDLVRASAGAEEVVRSAKRVEAVLDRAVRVFRPRDPLLGTQGPVTVYYWLLRHLSPKNDPHLREFLVEFENRRQMNRFLARKYGTVGSQVDPELVAFDTYRRNINDAGSIDAMFRTLLRQFNEFQHK